ncbi:unnamed protein product [Brugia pahangi]|uniref:DPPIV_N domain-containing protein n=1 Tax=Brugia pahangi TaxID=6280 RepID=A0A0N4THT6_BRUPA|nr:unnamed protein product [Brugia pahangi]
MDIFFFPFYMHLLFAEKVNFIRLFLNYYNIHNNELGYDGGPFFSPDGSKIVFRASRPNTTEGIQTYKDLLSYNLVSPLEMELYTINVDGSGLKKVTSLGGSNWAPFYMPDNRHIIFSSNFNETGGHFGAFNLYMIDEAGGDVERVKIFALLIVCCITKKRKDISENSCQNIC